MSYGIISRDLWSVLLPARPDAAGSRSEPLRLLRGGGLSPLDLQQGSSTVGNRAAVVFVASRWCIRTIRALADGLLFASGRRTPTLGSGPETGSVVLALYCDLLTRRCDHGRLMRRPVALGGLRCDGSTSFSPVGGWRGAVLDQDRPVFSPTTSMRRSVPRMPATGASPNCIVASARCPNPKNAT